MIQTPRSGDDRTESGALSVLSDALGGVYWERTGQDATKPDGFIRLPDQTEIDVEVYRNVIQNFDKLRPNSNESRIRFAWIAVAAHGPPFSPLTRTSKNFQN